MNSSFLENEGMGPFPNPLIKHNRLSKLLKIELLVKHDDLFPLWGGGSKARKNLFIIRDAQKKGANALVTAGAPDSNHCRVVALASAELGWPCIIVIHGKDDPSKSNLKIIKLTGARLRFVNLSEVAAEMDQAMQLLKDEGHVPYYIWGGGHCNLGSYAFFEAVREFSSQSKQWVPDFVIVASGTGGTQAGLHVGFKQRYPETKIIGISIARELVRGREAVFVAARGLCDFLKLPAYYSEGVDFRDQWIGSGYGAISPNVASTIREAAERGLITDPTYSGKALSALFDMARNGEIPSGSKVLFWHTGGIMNLLSTPLDLLL